MRLMLLTMIGLMTLAQTAAAKDKAAPEAAVTAPASRQATEEQSKALGDEARRAEDARRRAWDAKTRAITRGICSGC